VVESTPRTGSPGRNWGRIELIFTPRTYRYIGLQEFRGPSAHGPWTLGRAASLRSYRFVKTAPVLREGALRATAQSGSYMVRSSTMGIMMVSVRVGCETGPVNSTV
jgi:hypothetical protein